MIFPAEITAGVSPLTRTQARALGPILRNSQAYEGGRARYSGVDSKLMELVSAPASAAGVEATDDAAIKAKTMSALLTLLPREVGRGTVAVQGGDSGKDYSQVRDREDLIAFALRALFDEEVISTEDTALSNYAVVLPSDGGCTTSVTCRCGFAQCPLCRGFAVY